MPTAEALRANEAFYRALRSRDINAMEQLWANHSNIVCIHPGWAALTGRAAIMGSWRSIMGNPKQPPISFYGAEAVTLSPDAVAVICYEIVAGQTLSATNVFTESDGAARLVLHQAGVCSRPPPLDEGVSDRIS